MKESDRNQLEDQLIQSPEKLSEVCTYYPIHDYVFNVGPQRVAELHMKASEAKDKSREASKIYTKWQSLSTQTKPVPMVSYVVL